MERGYWEADKVKWSSMILSFRKFRIFQLLKFPHSLESCNASKSCESIGVENASGWDSFDNIYSEGIRGAKWQYQVTRIIILNGIKYFVFLMGHLTLLRFNQTQPLKSLVDHFVPTDKFRVITSNPNLGKQMHFFFHKESLNYIHKKFTHFFSSNIAPI